MSSQRTHVSRSLGLLLLFVSLFNATALKTHAQEVQRERRVSAPATKTTPTAAPATPAQSPTQTPPLPARRATVAAPKTVDELRARLQSLLDQPELAPAHVALKVASLDTGRALFAADSAKLMMPASNMKLYTVAAALDRLTPDFRFITSVYAAARPDAAGTVRGDLSIYGRGDPTYATRFNDGDYYKAIDDLAARIVAAGVKRVDGDLIGDESYFTGPALGPGWEWDDLQWYYGAPVSALTVDDNAIDLFIKPGVRVGAAGALTTGPLIGPQIEVRNLSPKGNSFDTARSAGNAPFVLLTINNRTTTAPRGSKREIIIDRPLGSNEIEVSGSLPLDDAGYSGSLAVPRPALFFVSLLRAELEKRGVRFVNNSKTINTRGHDMSPLDVSKSIEIANRQSPPLSEIAAQTLKPSQNLYAELLLRTLGVKFGAAPKQTSAEAGSAVVKNFLREAGVEADRLTLIDGSGLARSNLVTADATLQLLAYMSRHRYANVFREALPVAGVDGTLRNRMKGTPAAGNVRAKTGTLNNVSSLSGYVTSAAGERLVFSMMINHAPESLNPPRNYLDAVAELLASFAGRS